MSRFTMESLAFRTNPAALVISRVCNSPVEATKFYTKSNVFCVSSHFLASLRILTVQVKNRQFWNIDPVKHLLPPVILTFNSDPGPGRGMDL